jgi:hypothetical protein
MGSKMIKAKQYFLFALRIDIGERCVMIRDRVAFSGNELP